MIDKKLFDKYDVDTHEIADKLLPSYIAVYGEEYKDIIEKRIHSFTHVNAISSDRIFQMICAKESELFNVLTSFLVSKVAKLNKINLPYENLMKDYKQLKRSMKDLLNVKELNFNNKDLINIYKPLDGTEDEEYLLFRKKVTGNYSEQEINYIYDLYLELKKKYQLFLDKHQEERDYLKSCVKFKRENEEKYKKDFINEILIKIPFMKRMIIYRKILKGDSLYIGESLNDPGLIEAFSSNAEEILKANHDSGEIKKIKLNRIEYYKSKGINLGNDYDNYLGIIKAKRPELELSNFIREMRLKYLKLSQDSYYKETSNYDEGLEALFNKKLGLNYRYNMEKHQDINVCISANYTEVNGRFFKNNILFLPILDPRVQDQLDISFTHELGHCIESELEFKNSNCYSKSGFEMYSMIDKEIERPYEAFSEVIHQMISLEVLDHYYKNNEYNPLFDKYQGAGNYEITYERSMFLLKDFYQIYRKEIMDARMTGNMIELLNKVGQDNFDKLAEYLEEYGELNNDPKSIDFYKAKEIEKEVKSLMDKILNQEEMMKR